MNEYREKIHDFIQSHKEEIINTLCELVKIPSVRGVPSEGAPFGEECKRVLERTACLFTDNGFETELDSVGGYTVSYLGSGEKSIGLFAHGDVVAPGEDWTFSLPFEPIEKNGFLIGRGVRDDKCAIVSSLYIAKLIKELKIPFGAKFVCFTGSCEETGMDDIKNYVKTHKAPDFSIICDASFPMFRGDKAAVRFTLKSKVPFFEITDIYGGESMNIVLGKAMARIKYSEALYKSLLEKQTDSISVKENDGSIEISARGISQHAAFPEGSVNACLLIADLLKDETAVCEHDRHLLTVVSKLVSAHYGQALGIQNEDDAFGKLTVANGMVRVEDGCFVLSFDVRHGMKIDYESICESVEKACEKYSLEAKYISHSPAYLTDENNPYLVKCLEVYRFYTGNMDAKAGIDPGGTYGKYLPCAVEIGTQTRRKRPFELPNGHGDLHQSDECISIEGMLEAMEIAANMVIECSKI